MIGGLNLSTKLGIKKLIIEGDCQVIIIVIRTSTPNQRINSKLEYALTIMDSFEEIRIQHIYREGNKEADNLVNKGVDGEELKGYNNI